MTNAPTVLVAVVDALGRDTIERYLAQAPADMRFAHLEKMGLGNILSGVHHSRVQPVETELALAIHPASTWADSVMGHRELMGFIDPTPYELFHEGFPHDFVEGLERRIGRRVLFNKRAGGLDAIASNHDEHVHTGGVILYASMCDPIAQLAGHEKKISPEELKVIADKTFALAMKQDVRLTRVITRPYVLENGEFVRTNNRKDVVLQLPAGVQTFIDVARAHGVYTVSIGKSADVVNTKWDIDRSLKGKLPDELKVLYTMGTKDKNPYSIREALAVLFENRSQPTFILCNLPDTDSLSGHERNTKGALASMQAFDSALGLLFAAMPENSYLFVTADHGMKDGGDYGYHSREAVPMLGKGFGTRIADHVVVPTAYHSYAVLGDVCAQIFGFSSVYREQCKLNAVLR